MWDLRELILANDRIDKSQITDQYLKYLKIIESDKSSQELFSRKSNGNSFFSSCKTKLKKNRRWNEELTLFGKEHENWASWSVRDSTLRRGQIPVISRVLTRKEQKHWFIASEKSSQELSSGDRTVIPCFHHTAMEKSSYPGEANLHETKKFPWEAFETGQLHLLKKIHLFNGL